MFACFVLSLKTKYSTTLHCHPDLTHVRTQKSLHICGLVYHLLQTMSDHSNIYLGRLQFSLTLKYLGKYPALVKVDLEKASSFVSMVKNEHSRHC